MEAKFLGSQTIFFNGVEVSGLSSQKARAFLIYLILENKQAHLRSRLASLFWPDAPEQTALHNLRQAFSIVRKAINDCQVTEDVFLADREKIRFIDGVQFEVDALDFEQAIRKLFDKRGETGKRGFAIYSLISTLQKYKGPLLPSLSMPDSDLFEDWLIVRRESVNRCLIEGASYLVKYYENRREWGAARKVAELITDAAPWDEDAHYRLIKILLQLSQEGLALTHYHAAVRYLKEELQVEPGRALIAANDEIQQYLSSEKKPQVDFPSPIKLPGYATPFIGRKFEIEILENWISDPDTSVITITGPGGSGKTRLAVELAHAQNTLFKDGVFFVSISGCNTRTEIAEAILNVVEGSNEFSEDAVEDLLEWGAHRTAFLILDNVENKDITALFATEVTEKFPGILILFTSYSPLNLIGEKVFLLNGLGLSEGLSSDAVQLFFTHLQSERLLQANKPGFNDQVIKICELVEGLPLAINLAASQTRWMSVEQILSDLNERLTSLSFRAANLPERHRSIQASFENVWKHLDEREKRILPLLTIFESPFTSDVANCICDVTPSELSGLCERSLLIWDGEECYRFHRVLRQCAKEKSELSKEDEESFLCKYANWFETHLLELFMNRNGENPFEFHDKTASILPDLVQALDWFIAAKEWKKVERMITPLNDYFEGRSLFREGITFFESWAGKCSGEEEAVICQSMFLCRMALFKIYIQQFNNIFEMIERGLITAKSAGLEDEVAFCLNALSIYAIVCVDSSTAVQYAREALGFSRQIKNKEEENHSLYNLGYALSNAGDSAGAEKYLNECRLICEEQRKWRRLSKALNVLSDIACVRGDYHLALRYYENALNIAQKLRNKYSESLILNNMGTAYLELFIYDKAEKYFKDSLDICREIVDREGESIALSNLGEMAAYRKDFENALYYNQLALEIGLEINSTLGVMSSRIVLAEAYREKGDMNAARDELIALLKLAMQTENINFFHRALVEAVRLLIVMRKTDHLASFLLQTIVSDGAEESAKKKAQATLDLLGGGEQNPSELNTKEISTILIKMLSDS